jgi:8-oxo-dGTP pyrophosphatase MutT (NUDIX family)
MAFYTKIGLLVLNEDTTKFLVCQKASDDISADYIMPGGQLTEDNYLECLRNEIKEELDCALDEASLELIGEYEDIAAGHTNETVKITLYRGKLSGEPIPSSEIKFLHWIGKEDEHNEQVSAIIRHKIIPDLIKRKIIQ